MTKVQLEKQINMLLKDLEKCNTRCKKISKACGIEDFELLSYATEQTRLVLEYIESLKTEKNDVSTEV